MKPWQINFKRIGAFAVMVVLVLMMIDFNQRAGRLNHLTGQLGTVQGVATAVIETQVAFHTAIAYATSDEAVREYMYEDGGGARPGEKRVVPQSEPGSTPVMASPPTPAPVLLKKWEVWWELFFGD